MTLIYQTYQKRKKGRTLVKHGVGYGSLLIRHAADSWQENVHPAFKEGFHYIHDNARVASLEALFQQLPEPVGSQIRNEGGRWD